MHFWSVRNGAGHVLRSGYSQIEADVPLQAVNPGETAHAETELLPVHVEPAAATVAQVKARANRILSYSDWMVVRSLDTDYAMPPAISVYRQAVRDASNAIEAMDPIPADFRDPKYWPVEP